MRIDLPADTERIEAILRRLRIDAADLALGRGPFAAAAAAVRTILEDVARNGDEALVRISQKFDDPGFSADQIRVTPREMAEAATRVPAPLMSAIRRAISQVAEYQKHILPASSHPLERKGVEIGLRFTPLDSAGCYFPGGHAAYPSSLIMLAVPAQVAGVKKLVVCTPPSQYGRSDLVLAAAQELKLTEVYRAGGAAAIAAMAFGTRTIPAVDKIVGPGNSYVQLAKRLVAGAVGVDGFLGPSEVVVLADDGGDSPTIAADLLAQAEHDPGSAFLLTTSEALAKAVMAEIERQLATLKRAAAIRKALENSSAIIVGPLDELVTLSNRFAAEHVNLQLREARAVLPRLVHAGAVFVGRYSPIAAGDYVAGPSHCLPTNTTARFSSGISVYEFLKRSSVVRYNEEGIRADVDSIVALAEAEGLDAHAASARLRQRGA